MFDICDVSILSLAQLYFTIYCHFYNDENLENPDPMIVNSLTAGDHGF